MAEGARYPKWDIIRRLLGHKDPATSAGSEPERRPDIESVSGTLAEATEAGEEKIRQLTQPTEPGTAADSPAVDEQTKQTKRNAAEKSAPDNLEPSSLVAPDDSAGAQIQRIREESREDIIVVDDEVPAGAETGVLESPTIETPSAEEVAQGVAGYVNSDGTQTSEAIDDDEAVLGAATGNDGSGGRGDGPETSRPRPEAGGDPEGGP